jgi:RNA polymerase-interacting CarD/CdnL/TRCF family regulator
MPNQPQAPQALPVVKGKTLKLKLRKKRPANRKGKKIYTGEVIACIRLIRALFRYKCGRTKTFDFSGEVKARMIIWALPPGVIRI